MNDAWEPIGHRAPLPRIETAPSYTPAPQLIPEHLRVQIEHMEAVKRRSEGERIWAHVVASATGTLPPASQPASQPIEPLYGTSPALDMFRRLQDLQKRIDQAMGADA